MNVLKRDIYAMVLEYVWGTEDRKAVYYAEFSPAELLLQPDKLVGTTGVGRSLIFAITPIIMTYYGGYP